MYLPKLRGKYKLNYNISHLTWFKVGGNADILFIPEDLQDLEYFLRENKENLSVTVIGAGSNILVRDDGISGVTLKLGHCFTEIEELSDGNLAVGASCLNYNLAKFALSRSIKGFEFLIGIPGTIGGGVAMNAGAYGLEFKDIVVSIEAIDQVGNYKKFLSPDIGFSYRKHSLSKDLIFTKVIFRCESGNRDQIQSKMRKINQLRVKTQPITKKTAGSVFSNPEGYQAWKLIDYAKLRGHVVGGAYISDKHCNFIINDGNATASDIERLGEFIKNKVKQVTCIELAWEIKRIGK